MSARFPRTIFAITYFVGPPFFYHRPGEHPRGGGPPGCPDLSFLATKSSFSNKSLLVVCALAHLARGLGRNSGSVFWRPSTTNGHLHEYRIKGFYGFIQDGRGVIKTSIEPSGLVLNRDYRGAPLSGTTVNTASQRRGRAGKSVIWWCGSSLGIIPSLGMWHTSLYDCLYMVSGIPQSVHIACRQHAVVGLLTSLLRRAACKRTVSVGLETVPDYKRARMKCAAGIARYVTKVLKKSVLLS